MVALAGQLAQLSERGSRSREIFDRRNFPRQMIKARRAQRRPGTRCGREKPEIMMIRRAFRSQESCFARCFGNYFEAERAPIKFYCLIEPLHEENGVIKFGYGNHT